MSSEPTAPSTKQEARARVREIEQIDRLLAENKVRHEHALESENAPLLERREQLREGLAVYGNTELPPGEEGESRTIRLGGKRRRIYRRRSTQVEFQVPEKEIVKALQARKLWKLRFISVKISLSVNKDAVVKWPYILKKLPGLMRVRKMDSLYLAKADPKSKNEVLDEHELD